MDPELSQRITIEVGKCGGQPCIRGYRLRVIDILELLVAGADVDEILNDILSWSVRISWPPSSFAIRPRSEIC